MIRAHFCIDFAILLLISEPLVLVVQARCCLHPCDKTYTTYAVVIRTYRQQLASTLAFDTHTRMTFYHVEKAPKFYCFWSGLCPKPRWGAYDAPKPSSRLGGGYSLHIAHPPQSRRLRVV